MLNEHGGLSRSMRHLNPLISFTLAPSYTYLSSVISVLKAMCAHTHTHTHTHPHTHTHIHTDTHIHTHATQSHTHTLTCMNAHKHNDLTHTLPHRDTHTHTHSRLCLMCVVFTASAVYETALLKELMFSCLLSELLL